MAMAKAAASAGDGPKRNPRLKKIIRQRAKKRRLPPLAAPYPMHERRVRLNGKLLRRRRPRYVDPLSVPRLAHVLQHGRHAEQLLWYADALYRYADGVYRAEGEWVVQNRIRQIVLTEAKRRAKTATAIIRRSGADWCPLAFALKRLKPFLSAATLETIGKELETVAGNPLSAASQRESTEARFGRKDLVAPVVYAVTTDVRARTGDLPVNADLDTINVANGLLDWRTGALRPHDPTYLSTIQVPVAYDGAATCPLWSQFLTDILPDDLQRLLQEWVGYCLIPDTRQQKALLLLGSGANGKSTALGILVQLLGSANVSSVTLQALCDNRFAAAELVDKLANVFADLPATEIKATSMFKAIVGGDEIPAERKYKDLFKFRPFARLIYSANRPPAVTAQDADSIAYWRRWHVVPFGNSVPETKQDKNLPAKLAANLPGILNWALVGLRRLQERGYFDPPLAAQDALAGYRSRSDSVVAFIEEACELGPDCSVRQSAVYPAARNWSVLTHTLIPGRTEFLERFRKHTGAGVSKDAGGNEVLQGVGLRGVKSVKVV